MAELDPRAAAALSRATRRALPAGERGRPSCERHFAVRRAVFVERAGACSSGDDRDERDDDPATLHVVGLVGGEVVGAVRLYPLDADGLWKGDRLAVLPAPGARSLGAMLVRFAVRTAGELGGTRMVAQMQVPNVHFFERLGWARRRRRAPTTAASPHQPMTIELSAAREAGERLAPRGPRRSPRRRRTKAAARASRRSSPHARAREAAARERRARRRRRAPAVAASRKPKLGNVTQPALDRRRPAGRGSRSRSSVAPQPAASSSCSSEPATPGIETSRAAWQSPASATSTSASPSSRSRSGARSRSEVKTAGRRACTGRRGRTRRAGRRRAARSRRAAAAWRCPCRSPTAPADRPSVRWPPTTGTSSRSRRPGEPVEDARGVRLVGARRACRRCASGRPPIARTSETLVTTRRGAGGERVGREQRRADRLAAEHEEAVAVRDQRGVVAVVDAPGRPCTSRRSRLARSPGGRDAGARAAASRSTHPGIASRARRRP